jgi:hypothetical protein
MTLIAIILLIIVAVLLTATAVVFACRLESLGLNVRFTGRKRLSDVGGKAAKIVGLPEIVGAGSSSGQNCLSAGGGSVVTVNEGDIAVKEDADSKQPNTEKPSAGWKPWGDHPAVVLVSVLAGLITIAAFVQPWFSPFNFSAKAESPLTAEEGAYLDLAEDAMRDAVSLQRATAEALGEPRKFDSPEFTNLSRRVVDKLQGVMEAEPSERLKDFHKDVITFLENAHESSALMARYSYSDDKDAYTRASSLTREGTRAMNRATAELHRLRNKQRG